MIVFVLSFPIHSRGNAVLCLSLQVGSLHPLFATTLVGAHLDSTRFGHIGIGGFRHWRHKATLAFVPVRQRDSVATISIEIFQTRIGMPSSSVPTMGDTHKQTVLGIVAIVILPPRFQHQIGRTRVWDGHLLIHILGNDFIAFHLGVVVENILLFGCRVHAHRHNNSGGDCQ